MIPQSQYHLVPPARWWVPFESSSCQVFFLVLSQEVVPHVTVTSGLLIKWAAVNLHLNFCKVSLWQKWNWIELNTELNTVLFYVKPDELFTTFTDYLLLKIRNWVVTILFNVTKTTVLLIGPKNTRNKLVHLSHIWVPLFVHNTPVLSLCTGYPLNVVLIIKSCC